MYHYLYSTREIVMSLLYFCFIQSVTMFANLGLFKNLSCPQSESCTRINCPFSHSQNIPPPKQLNLLPQSQNPAKTTPASVIRKAPESAPLVPAKRPAVPSPQKPLPLSQGPPRKLQKVGTSAQPRALPSSARSEVSFKVMYYPLHIRPSKPSAVRCTRSQSYPCPITCTGTSQTGIIILSCF